MILREWIADCLAGPKLIPFLESELMRQRREHQERLAEKDARIRELRLQLADVQSERERLRIPSAVKIPATKVLSGLAGLPPASLDWTGELAQMLQEEEDAHSKRREAIHEQTSHDVS